MKRSSVLNVSVAFSALLFGLVGRAEVKLPKVLSDHAVLQRNAPIHLWGWADPGERVTVSLHDQKQSAVADALGSWSLSLAPEAAGGPFQLVIQATNTVTISDLLIGDVWFASGQSNMEMPLKGFPGSAVVKDGAQEIAHSNQPQIRLLRVHQKFSDHPLHDLQDPDEVWTLCTPETAADFSAVAYFFGREIQQHEKVPIGLIDSTWGGTPAEAWTSMDGLSADASLMPVFAEWAKMADQTADLPATRAMEERENATARQANAAPPKHPWHPNPSSWAPASLYNAMIAPFTGFRIKGVIWYQGEANSERSRAAMYSRVFPALISDWRSQWRQGDFPFFFVQLSSYKTNSMETWGVVRDAQRRTLSVADTGMAVSLDVGQADNVHPPDKQTVGHRLALSALDLTYGEHAEASGPLFREAAIEENRMRIWFDHGAGITAKGGSLEGFEIAGKDHNFFSAVAKIEGDTVAVSSPSVKTPRFVRYGWADVTPANLYNSAGLPAPTFTTESVADAGRSR